jgi:hypothetical protein
MKMKLSEYTARQSWLKGTTPKERVLMLAAILAFHAVLGIWWMNVERAEASGEPREYVTYYDLAVFEAIVGGGDPRLDIADSVAAKAAAAPAPAAPAPAPGR